MKTIFKNYNELLKENLLFRNKNLFSKIYVILIYGILFISLICIATKSIVIAVKLLFLSVIFCYIMWMILYIAMVAPEIYIFKNAIIICKRVEEIFKNEFYNYDTYLEDNAVLNLDSMLNKNIPDKKMLSFWKYKLSTSKETIQITLPVVALMILCLLKVPVREDILNIIKKYVQIDTTYWKWILGAFLYPYIFIVYYSNIDRINGSLSKIDLLRDII